MALIALFLCLIVASVANGASVGNEKELLNHIPRATETWCDPVLGCLDLTDDWYSPGRPLNKLPDSRADINTRFLLHTRESNPPKGEDVLITADDMGTITGSTFDKTKPIKLIIHGFIDTGYKLWLYDLADAFLNYGDYNVIRVDWGDGSMPLYEQASANIRVVGLEIGNLITSMEIAYGIDPADVHCLGHSLGAHACGYGGEQVPGMGRITGMDPAGPYFTGTASFIHLDPTDAVFVDNIHTDADSIFLLGYGTAQPFGNIDFYPNSGHDQPRCDPVSVSIDAITDELVGTGRDMVACSHIRAITYFQESLTSQACNWQAHECYNYESFEYGQCGSCGTDNSKCAYMGIRADEYVNKERYFGLFFLDTDGDDPYCMQHYQIRILTAPPTKDNGAESWVMGKLMVSIYGDAGPVVDQVQITDNHQRIDHGQIATTLMVDHANVGTILRVELKWVYDDNVFNPGTWCWGLVCNRALYVNSVEISPINDYPETTRLADTTLTCYVDGSTTKIKDGNTESFVPSESCQTLDL